MKKLNRHRKPLHQKKRSLNNVPGPQIAAASSSIELPESNVGAHAKQNNVAARAKAIKLTLEDPKPKS